ncbi:CvpA family protein [Vaginisenegalia massiliensis]|uniref:CvpA family protein n=1 Tax=Vaginisenegalia massiliensis TaxID=2058294 RepID=UPI000F5202C5|nr:CvpA family protein [Vaginisenegalia massiliensis]
MLLTLIIVIGLLYGFYMGYRRGILLQSVHLVGLAVTILIALKFNESLAKLAELFVPFPALQQGSQLVLYDEATSFFIDDAFYRAISFVAILFLGWLIIQLVTYFLKDSSYFDVENIANKVAGAIFNTIVTYFVLFLGLFILSLVPLEPIQQMFVDSPIAYSVVSSTPVVSDMANEAWLRVLPTKGP